jgi:hypothetical protein
MRRSRVDRREKPLDAGQGHDSAEVSARLERCVGLELTEEKKALSAKQGRDPAEVNVHLKRHFGPVLDRREARRVMCTIGLARAGALKMVSQKRTS